eukprot:6214847-Pleurochrysis_carterae.AAC.11
MEKYARGLSKRDCMSYSIPSAYATVDDGTRAASRMHCKTRASASESPRAVAMPRTIMMRGARSPLSLQSLSGQESTS